MPEKDAWTHKVATVLQFIDEGHAERGWKTCEQRKNAGQFEFSF